MGCRARLAGVEPERRDRKSTRLNSSHTEIYTLSLHDALPISRARRKNSASFGFDPGQPPSINGMPSASGRGRTRKTRSEEHTSELQSHRDLHSFPTRRSSDLTCAAEELGVFRVRPRPAALDKWDAERVWPGSNPKD